MQQKGFKQFMNIMEELRFNSGTPEVKKKDHTYLSKSVGKSCRFV